MRHFIFPPMVAFLIKSLQQDQLTFVYTVVIITATKRSPFGLYPE